MRYNAQDAEDNMSHPGTHKKVHVVKTALEKHSLDIEIIELSESTRTALDASKALHCEVAQIVKSLLFHTEKTYEPVLILASGSNRVNEKAIETIIGEKIVKADADYTRRITGFVIGGVPPLGHKENIQYIFIDEDLLKYQKLWAAAGTPNSVFSLQASDIQTLTGGKVISIK